MKGLNTLTKMVEPEDYMFTRWLLSHQHARIVNFIHDIFHWFIKEQVNCTKKKVFQSIKKTS